MEQLLSLVEKARSFHSHKTLDTDVGKADVRKLKTAKLWMQHAEVVERRGTLRKSVSKLNIPAIHLKFHISLDYRTLRGRGSREGWNKMENSTDSTVCPQTVLLKADTGADVNLMNKQTFDQLFGQAKVLQLTPIRMENYGNSAVKVFGMFHAFLRWKDKVYR